MKIYRYGIIGCGMMGQEHMRNIALLPDACVGPVFEPDSNMATAARALAPDVTLCDSIDDLLAIADLDCLLIASPNFCHADQLQQIAETRPLPLLIEKPLFTDPMDAARILDIGRSYPAPIWVAMEYRYMPPIAALLDNVETATGGACMATIREHRFPFLAKVGDWNRFNRYSGGTFVEKCCHFFDLMRLILPGEPVRVMASGGQAVNHLDEIYDGEVPDILDHGYVVVEFDTGCRAMLELCMFAEGSEFQENVSVVGPQGKLEAFVPGPGRFWDDARGPAPQPLLANSPRSGIGASRKTVPVPAHLLAAGDHNGSTYFQHEKFLALVKGETSIPEVTLEDGWMSVVLGMAAQHSIQTGQSVDFASFVSEIAG